MKYTCSKRCTCVAGPPLPGSVLSRRTWFGLPRSRLVNAAPLSPGFRSFAGVTVMVRMDFAAFSTLRGWAGLSIDNRSLEGAGAIASRYLLSMLKPCVPDGVRRVHRDDDAGHRPRDERLRA